MKEHFSIYGDLASVELEGSEVQDNDASEPSNVSARVSFTIRRFAEKAFLHGKTWQGHKLQFKWVASNNSRKESTTSGNISESSNIPSDSSNQPSGGEETPVPEKVPANDADEPKEQVPKEDTDPTEDDKNDPKPDEESNSTSTPSPQLA